MAEDNSYQGLSVNNPFTAFKRELPPLYNNVPSGMPPAVVQNNEIAGNYQGGPKIFLTPAPGNDLVTSIGDALKDAGSWARNPNVQGRAIDYGAGWRASNFERYYNHPLFKSIGFNPRVDNETIYNSKSSWWDDYVRMGNSWGSLFWSGWKSPYDFGSEETAYDFDKTMAIAMSNRPNSPIGNFFTNLSLQSAHTIGMMSEMLAENYFLAGAAKLLGGGGTMGALAIAKSAPGIRRLFQFGEAARSVNQLNTELRNINNTRDMVSAIQTTGTAAKVGNFINPFQSTTKYITNLYDGANGFREMSNFVKMRKGAGAVFRDLREMNWAVSESMMEGNLARTQYNDEEIRKFYDKNQRMPTIEEAGNIYQKSLSVDFAVSLTNMPIIYYSNRIVFDSFFKGFRPASAVESTMLQGSKRVFTKTADWKMGKSVYSFIDDKATKKLSRFLTRSPYLPWTKKYFLGNISEGMQEVFQDVASDWWRDYYGKMYEDPAAAAFYSNIASLGSALGNTFSWRGLETLLSGFLMGSIVQGVGSAVHLPQMAPALYKDLLNKGKVDEMKKIRQMQEDVISNTVNEVFNNGFLNYNKNIDNSLKQRYLQKKMDQAQRDGNQAEFQDAKDEMMLEQLYFLASSGRMDLVKDHVQDLQQMSDQELVEAFDANINDSSKLRERLNTLGKRSEDMSIRYENYKSKFPNPFDLSTVDREKDPIGYRQLLIDHETWDTAVKDALLTESLFERNVERNQSIYNELATSKLISDANATDITSLMSRKELNKEISVLKAEIKGLELGDVENKREAARKSKKLDALLDYANNLDEYVYNYKRQRQLMIQLQNKRAVNKPGNIVVDKNNNEEYEILEVNEDGSLLVIDALGEMNVVDSKDVKAYSKNTVSEAVLKRSNKNLYDSFRKYIGVVSNSTGSSIPSDDKINNAFNKIRDNYTLQNENEYLTKTMNVLSNPSGLMQYAERMRGIIAVKHKNYAEYLKKSWANLAKVYKDNAFLNNLYGKRAAIDPEDAEKVIRRADFTDVIIYDIETGQPIQKNDPRYDDIQKYISDYKKAVADDIAKTKKEKREPVEEEKKEEGEKEIDQQTKDKLVALIKEENKLRKKNSETLLSEDINDPETSKWITENDDASDIMDEFIRTASKKRPSKKPGKGESFDVGEVPEGLKDIKNLWKNPVVLTEDGVNYINEDNDLFARVSDLKVNKYGDTISLKGERAAARGQVADHVLRKVIAGKIVFEMSRNKPSSKTLKETREIVDKYIADKRLKIKFTDDAVKSLVITIDAIDVFLKENKLTLYSDIPSLWGELKGKKVAGTIDLLAKDSKGNYYIIDLKTNSEEDSRRLESGQKKYLINDTIQLNAYAELFKQRTGKSIKGIYILPVIAEHDASNYGIVEEFIHDTIESDETLEEGMIPISMEKDIYQLDKELGTKNRKLTLVKPTKKKVVEGKEVEEEVVRGFDKDIRATLRSAGFFSTAEQRLDDGEITGMTRNDAMGKIEIFEMDNGKYGVAFTKMDETTNKLDEKTYEETEIKDAYEDITDAVNQALLMAELNLEMLRSKGMKEVQIKRANFEAKVNNIETEEDYDNFYQNLIMYMEDRTWLKNNGFKSVVEVQDILDEKEEALGIKKTKKAPSKNKDTKTKSNKAMDIVDYDSEEIDEHMKKVDELKSENSMDELLEKFKKKIKC